MKAFFIALALALGLVAGSVHLTAAPVNLLTDSHGISGFELSGNGIHWWAGPGRCGGEFPFDASVRLRGTLNSATTELALDCRLHQGDVFNTVRDEAYFYFFRQSVLHRKAINAAQTDPSQVMPAPGGAAQVTLPAGQLSATLAYGNGYLYWSSFTASSGAAAIRRMRADGSANPTTVNTLSGGSAARKLQYFTYQSGANEVECLAVLLTDGRLFRMIPGSLFSLSLGTGVADFAIHRRWSVGSSVTYVYAARGIGTGLSASTPPGTLVRIDASNGSASTIYTATGQNQILGVATDSTSSTLVAVGSPPKNIYLLESSVSCGSLFCTVTDGKIWRHPVPGSTSGWGLIVASGAEGNLRSDDDYLYYLRYSTSIATKIDRIASDAPALQLNVAADTFEVVQNSQDLNQSFSLVGNKPTFVRGYAHLTVNTTGKSKWFPSATLRGQRNGIDLPGSPLAHVNNTSIDTTANLDTLRGNLNSSFLFELPASWTAPGNVTLTFTVNPTSSLPETVPSPAADNAVVRTVSFIRKDRPCLVLVPMRTTAPIYNPNATDSGLPEILERARSLLPVENFRVWTVSEPVEKPVFYVEVEALPCPIPPFVCPIPVLKMRLDPFDMQDDKEWALFWLIFSHFLSSDPGGCPDTHWVGTVHRSIQNFNGIGGRSGLNLQDLAEELPPIPLPDFGTSDFLVVRMATDEGANLWDRPLGGRSLAHELGHNYGRKHINQQLSSGGCGGGTPEGPYDNYPFDQCTIGPTTGNAAVFGFDSISRRVLMPTVGGDLMSYSDTRWISKFTWDAIAQNVGTLSPISAEGLWPAGQPDSGPFLLIHGSIDPGQNLAVIRPGYMLPPGAGNAQKIAESLKAMAAVAEGNDYRLRLLDGAGRPLEQWPLLMMPMSHGGRSDSLAFIQFIPWNSAARRLQVWRGNTWLTEKIVSASAPIIALNPPVLDPVKPSIDLSWMASDADQELLLFTVQYSADDGANWVTLRLNLPQSEVRLDRSTLPGSTTARLRVLATDGIHTAAATSERFTIARHAPVPVISGVSEGQRIPYGAPVEVHGMALDAEDGSLDESRLSWRVSGPVNQLSQGSSLSLFNLSPGNYDLTLGGRDSDDTLRETTRRIEVMAMHVPDGSGLVLDGVCGESAYQNAAFARLSLGNGPYVSARLVHADGRLYVSFTDLPYGGSLGGTTVGLRIDVNASGEPTPQTGDIGFAVDENGIPSQLASNGGTMTPTLNPQLGYHSAVVRGGSRWSAEMSIDDALIGGWNHGARLVLYCDRPASATDGYWPRPVNLNSPQTWAAAHFGTLPVPTNRAPVALAGSSQDVPVASPTTLYLDGSASYDPDGNQLSYGWSQVSGPAVTLLETRSATPRFLTGPVTNSVTLRFRLFVNDGALNSLPADVEVSLRPVSPAPSYPLAPRNGAVLADGSFAGAVTGEPEQPYTIQATTNFLDWISIGGALSDPFGTVPIIDRDAPRYPHRFYRGRKN